jgi:hypothetical protein
MHQPPPQCGIGATGNVGVGRKFPLPHLSFIVLHSSMFVCANSAQITCTHAPSSHRTCAPPRNMHSRHENCRLRVCHTSNLL